MSKKSKHDDEIVLSYHDSLIREADVELLRGPHWINDVIIGFYFEYLNKKAANSECKDLLFISPELTQLLKLTESSNYDILLEPINAKSSSFIFFPLNNCDSKESAGGSHWSLLVYSHPEKTCFHLDSCKDFNAAIAKNFTKSITDYFCGKGLGIYRKLNIPQQDNSYDCGLYVLCAADSIADHVVIQPKIENCSFESLKFMVEGKRKKLLELIDYLKNDVAEVKR